MRGNDFLRHFARIIPRQFVEEIGQCKAFRIISDKRFEIVKNTPPVGIEPIGLYRLSV